jgi:hypothetical protein
MSGLPWLELSDEGQGKLNLIGDTQALPAGGGGLLAVRRIDDDHWISGVGHWQPDRPQWFPFRRDTNQSGGPLIEVAAAPLLELFASPPGDALSVRLRFPATTGRDVTGVDLALSTALTTSVTNPLQALAEQASVSGAAHGAAGAEPLVRTAQVIASGAIADEASVPADPSTIPDSSPSTSALSEIEDSAQAFGETPAPPETTASPGALAKFGEAPSNASAEMAQTLSDDNERDPVARSGPAGNALVTRAGGSGDLVSPVAVTSEPATALARAPGAIWGDGFEYTGDQLFEQSESGGKAGGGATDNRTPWRRLALLRKPMLLSILGLLTLGVLTWSLWPDGESTPDDGPVPDGPVRDKAYIADLLARKPEPPVLYQEAEEAEADGDCEAALLFYRAAAKGDAGLAGQLGRKYDPEGFIPSRCISQASSISAEEWYMLADAAGDAYAQRRVGELLLGDGDLPVVVRKQALNWLRKAAGNGDEIAAQRLQALGER